MDRWHKLTKALREDGRARIVLSFSRIEEILGHELPAGYKTGRGSVWRAKHTFPRSCGYRPSFMRVPPGHVAFVSAKPGVPEAAGRKTGRPSVWDGLLAVLAMRRGKDVLLSLEEIEGLRGVPLEERADFGRFRSRWMGRDKPWTKLGFRVTWNDVPAGHVRFTPIRPRPAPQPRVRRVPSKPRPPKVWDSFLLYLQGQIAGELVLSFDEIGRLRGRPLPRSAHVHRAAWAGVSQPWVPIGWRTNFRAVPAGHVRFYRSAEASGPPADGRPLTVPARRAVGARHAERGRRPTMWDGLIAYLSALQQDEAVLALEWIERLIGRKLPSSAYASANYWHNCERAWNRAGWKTLHNRALAGHVTFYRTEEAGGRGRPRPKSPWTPVLERLVRTSRPTVTLKFDQIERLLGRELPPSARCLEGYWSQPEQPWIALGWRVSHKGLPGDSVRFVRAPSLAPARKAWDQLVEVLRQAGGRRVVLQIDQVEAIVKGRLPEGAWKNASYWQAGKRPWYAAGFIASFVDVPAGHVAFEPRRTRAKPANPLPAAKAFRLEGRKNYRVVKSGHRRTESPPGQAPAFAKPISQIAAIVVHGVGDTARREVPAREFFVSKEFREMRKVAEASGLRWYILDEFLGLLSPSTPVLPRPPRRSALSVANRGTWRRALIQGLVRDLGTIEDLAIAILAEAPVALVVADLLEVRGARAVGREALEGIRG